MREDVTREFFKAGPVYTDRRPEWGTGGMAMEFQAGLVTVHPATGKKVAFGWARWEHGEAAKADTWEYPHIATEEDFPRYSVKEEVGATATEAG